MAIHTSLMKEKLELLQTLTSMAKRLETDLLCLERELAYRLEADLEAPQEPTWRNRVEITALGAGEIMSRLGELLF